MTLPEAIERLRMMHSDASYRMMHSDASYRMKEFGGLMADEFQSDIDALAVCIEALEAPHSTLNSAPPTTKEERGAK